MLEMLAAILVMMIGIYIACLCIGGQEVEAQPQEIYEEEVDFDDEYFGFTCPECQRENCWYVTDNTEDSEETIIRCNKCGFAYYVNIFNFETEK